MNRRNGLGTAEYALLALAFVSALCLAFNIVALAMVRDEILLNRGPLSGLGWVILCGFCIVFLFCGSYVIWTVWRLRGDASGSRKQWCGGHTTPFGSGMLAFGICSMILMFGAKVMVDEIGRETLLGWETTGEWIILFCCLTVQLIFILLAITRLTISHRHPIAD
jgi:hypothetical protein